MERFDLGVILSGVHGCIRERDLEILVAIFAGAMMHTMVGVIGSWHQTAIRDEVSIGEESFDAVYLQIDGKGREFANAGDIEKSLDVIVRNENAMERFLEVEDLRRKGFTEMV